MAAGLQVWDGAGRITLDTSDNTSRFLGFISQVGLHARSGSVYDARFTLGRPYHFFSPKTVATTPYGQPLIASVGIRVENNTLYWDVYYSGANYYNDCGTIVFGVY